MIRHYNFCAGPATLPTEVLEQAQAEFLDWRDCGCSIMEMSHRGKYFIEVAAEAEQDLRDVMSIPENYKVLFMHGGGRGQFAAVAMNFMGDKGTADYINMGVWSKLAIEEARRFGDVNVIADTEDTDFTTITDVNDWETNPDAAYLHIVDNETVNGVEFFEVPDTKGVPLVSDMSSNILSRPVDISKFACIYAGAQKNIGPSGIAVAIVRDDMLGKAMPNVPSILDYTMQAKKDSMLNTPPTYAWYLSGLVFKWVKKQGGLEVMKERNQQKTDLLYDFLDNSSFYHNPVDKKYRSRMNVIFFTPDADTDKRFVEASEKAGLLALKGHRSRGGMRASIYNAMPIEGVKALIEFMKTFEKANG